MKEPETSAGTATGAPSREQVEAAILGSQPRLTSDDVESGSGLDQRVAKRYWRALGFADAGSQAAFTDADVDALRSIGRMRGAGLDDDTLIRLTRAVGHTMSRLADWEVATLVEVVEKVAADDEGGRLAATLRVHEDLGSEFEDMILYAWRRHLAAAVSRVEMLGAHDADLHTAELTVGFADLVGFSAYSNVHTQAEIGEVVEAFEARAADAVTLHRGRVIKTLGDSVLYVCTTPVEAYDVAAEIVRVVGKADGLPDVRVGLATGPVILRMGDVYGPAVNLAARMVTVARRNRVIADDATCQGLPEDEFSLRVLPLRPIHGFGDIEPIAVKRKR